MQKHFRENPMSKSFKHDMPIYTQIIEMIQVSIIRGTYIPGEKIPSVRDLAIEYGVNPNTMQKALTKLEEQGLLYTERTSGRFVTEDIKQIEKLQKEIPKKIIGAFLRDMDEAGIPAKKVIEHIESYISENMVK